MQTVNLLPTSTWNHLGVNQAPAEAGLPMLPSALPAVQLRTVLPSGVSPQAQAALPWPVSGAGEALDQLAEQHANSSLHLSVRGAISDPVLLEYTLDRAHPAAVAHHTLHAAAGSRITLIELVRGDWPEGIHLSLTRVWAEAGADVTLIQLQMTGSGCRSWSGVSVHAEERAHVTLSRASLGGSLSLAGSRAELLGRESGYTLRSIYYGQGDGLLDFNDTAVHIGPDTHSELQSAGVLADQCSKILRGTIDFRRGAVGGVGHEREDVLLLSPRVRSRTAPLILCGEERVDGQHAATAGRPDERVLYYMASRGLSEQEAKKLLIAAKFAPVVDSLPPDLQCQVRDYLERRLDL